VADARRRFREPPIVIEELTDREFPISPALHRMMMGPLDHSADVRTLELALPGRGPARISFSTIADFPFRARGSFGVGAKP
jgi:hypothetical protein